MIWDLRTNLAVVRKAAAALKWFSSGGEIFCGRGIGCGLVLVGFAATAAAAGALFAGVASTADALFADAAGTASALFADAAGTAGALFTDAADTAGALFADAAGTVGALFADAAGTAAAAVGIPDVAAGAAPALARFFPLSERVFRAFGAWNVAPFVGLTELMKLTAKGAERGRFCSVAALSPSATLFCPVDRVSLDSLFSGVGVECLGAVVSMSEGVVLEDWVLDSVLPGLGGRPRIRTGSASSSSSRATISAFKVSWSDPQSAAKYCCFHTAHSFSGNERKRVVLFSRDARTISASIKDMLLGLWNAVIGQLSTTTPCLAVICWLKLS